MLRMGTNVFFQQSVICWLLACIILISMFMSLSIEADGTQITNDAESVSGCCSCRWCFDKRCHSSDGRANVKVDGYTQTLMDPPSLLSSHRSLSPHLSLSLAVPPIIISAHQSVSMDIWSMGDASEKLDFMGETFCLKSEMHVKPDSVLDHSNFLLEHS